MTVLSISRYLANRLASCNLPSISSPSLFPSIRNGGVGYGNGLVSSIYGSIRGYIHWKRAHPEDFEFPYETMPKDMDQVMKKDPKMLDFYESYWYWRLRSESTLLDTDKLASKSYKQLARDMGMPLVTMHNQHFIGLLELYEYLKSSPFVGPFGTIESPVIVPSVHTERFVACTGGTGDNEHTPLWFRCREGFLYRCGECDQIFMLVRALPDIQEMIDQDNVQGQDPDIIDIFDKSLIDKGQRRFNNDDHVRWETGDKAYKQIFMEGGWGNEVPALTPEQAQIEPLKDVHS